MFRKRDKEKKKSERDFKREEDLERNRLRREYERGDFKGERERLLENSAEREREREKYVLEKTSFLFPNLFFPSLLMVM